MNKVSAAIQDYVESNGYGVVRDYVGHGIGRDMHEDPEIPNYRTGRPGPKTCKGYDTCNRANGDCRYL